MFYAKLYSVIDRFPSRDTLIVLGDFNTVCGTGRAAYELFVGNVSSSLFLNYAKFRRLRVGCREASLIGGRVTVMLVV